jgi:pyridoxal phosphate enzyme (YggS family)
MNFLNNYKVIKNEIFELKTETKIIIVTKNQSFDSIVPIINEGHLHFGENKVQEANSKWGNFLKNEKKIKLHLIGKLQTNKAKDAFDLFDYIHTLDSEKLAKVLSNLESKSEKKIKYFIQLNIGNELQKNGISQSLANEFIKFCCNDLKLNIIGLMCIPPVNLDPVPFFKKMQELKILNNLSELSMGMSSDYKHALNNGATFIRIGSVIFK